MQISVLLLLYKGIIEHVQMFLMFSDRMLLTCYPINSTLNINTKCALQALYCENRVHSPHACVHLLFSQDGKTAEDLAHADQHELIVSLLGKLKKVKNNYHATKRINVRLRALTPEGKLRCKARFHKPSSHSVYF